MKPSSGFLLLMALSGSVAFQQPTFSARTTTRTTTTRTVWTRTPLQLSSNYFEQDPLSSAENGNGSKNIPAFRPLKRPVKLFDPYGTPLAQTVQNKNNKDDDDVAFRYAAASAPPPPPPSPPSAPIAETAPEIPQQQMEQQQMMEQPPQQQQPLQQQQQPQMRQQQPPQQPPQEQTRRSSFGRDSEFDKVEVSSFLNDPEFKRRVNDIHTYFDLFDDPQAEWSSSEYIRREHHRRKKERKKLGHSQRVGTALEVSGSESLQLYARDNKGNQVGSGKRLVRYTRPSQGNQ
ncbi:hypothetical protein IV203_026373 [Nitzschia inconspicua]|uniref:Uncharacterized protein n=1 Tax=Nitzschia inconspicua TaxID=303405 RepID=A0A9K3PX69_9STRA|nr:hypothetical protein IV203_026373 [Nitzschia inconspicua]